MKHSALIAVAAILLLAFAVAIAQEGTSEGTNAPPISPTKKIQLFNGKDFNGWKMFLSDSGVDVNTVWSVKDGGIRCEGKPNGYIRTTKDYANYKLHVEWRWADTPRNSGVLLHMSEPDKVWPRSIEAQLMNGNAGDFYVIDGTNFKEHLEIQSRRFPKKHESNEKPAGEWNVLEAVCDGATIRITINGLLQNEATECTVSSGKICLQSEGAPIEFRNVTLEPAK
jgi:hypothetical protein